MTANRNARDWRFKTTRSSGSTPIRFATYSKSDNPRGLLLFLNGRTEWIEKYSFLPQLLNLPTDIMFITLDHRGQGASGGIRADIDSYDYYVDDVKRVLQKIGLDLPLYIIGHSMGGLITLYACLKGRITPERVLLSAPLLGFNQLAMKAPLFKLALSKIRQSKLGPIPHKFYQYESYAFDGNPYTHDIERFALIRNSPYRVPPATFKWLYASLDAIDAVFNPKLIPNLKSHVMILMGSDERIVNCDAIPKWIKRAAAQTAYDISTRRIQGAKHELFNESEPYLSKVIGCTKEWFREIW